VLEAMAFQRRREPAADGLHFGQLGHGRTVPRGCCLDAAVWNAAV
jgi:hypothetical protein